MKSILRRTRRRVAAATGRSSPADPSATATSPSTRRATRSAAATQVVDLTRVEFRLLEAILGADGRVLSRDQLLDAVYGHEAAEVLDRTIDVHIRRLRDKLDDDPDAPRYVQTVRGVGYRAAPGS